MTNERVEAAAKEMARQWAELPPAITALSYEEYVAKYWQFYIGDAEKILAAADAVSQMTNIEEIVAAAISSTPWRRMTEHERADAIMRAQFLLEQLARAGLRVTMNERA